MKHSIASIAACACALTSACAADPKAAVRAYLDRDFPRLESLYTHLHQNPELSFQEEKTARRFALELREAGYAVTEKVGGHGVVGVLTNGAGPVVLLRTDLDGLPVTEKTGLPYASTVTEKDAAGQTVGVMHACGHDAHISIMSGAATFLARHKEFFQGTLVVIGQPAEERGAGAKAMLADGLFSRFPKPDYCLALHVDPREAVGTLHYVSGFMMASVDSIDITIHGVGGHGAYPESARDPIVLAAQTVLALQTLVSREKRAIDPAVITVGSIHGGTKHNIIPETVNLQVTLRTYSDTVRTNLIAGMERIVRGLAGAAGIPENRMPTVKVDERESIGATYNDPALTERWVGVLGQWLGQHAVEKDEPVMGGEDFGAYGRTPDKIPICMLWVGSVSPERMKAGAPLPPAHSPYYPNLRS